MIYLIDDKKLRQNEFGWSENKFAQYSSLIKPLYKIEDITQIEKDLYSEKNIILYHESFLDFTRDKDKAIEQREKLTKIAAKTNELSVAFFSGSQGSRSLNENIAYLPVSTLYQNLEILVTHHRQASVELKYLLFGENPEIEKDLDKLLTNANKNIDTKPALVSGRNLFIRPNLKNIQNAIEGAKEVSIFSDVSDEKISEKLDEWLSETEYDNIFLPLCFGQTLSDFNGLRLATHIRCNPSKNQLKRIFIYGFVGLDYLIENEYFNILKTKNIQLVSYSKKAFEKAVNVDFNFLELEELAKEIKKLKLDPPLNYADSHSITNEWAIHQWAKTIGCDETDELTKVFQNVEANLYFKYLRTINPISELDRISPEKLKIKHEGKPKVLLIDDEANKGWYEIFEYLIGDLNGIHTDCLAVDYKNLCRDEVIEKSIDKIFTDAIDVIILDFRLNPSDFESKNSEEITSIKLLKEIKKRNPGIQIIVFTASNKVWNLLELQANGANGFLLKESPELTVNSSYTFDSIISLCKQMEFCFSNTYLKEVWKVIEEIRKLFSANPLIRYYPNDLRSLRGIQYQNLLLLELDSMYNILNSQDENRLSYAMLIQFKILECIVEIFIPEKAKDGNWLFYDGSKVKYFYTEDNNLHERNESLDFFDKAIGRRVNMKIPAYEYNSTRNKIDCLVEQKLIVDNKSQVHKKIKSLVNYRNGFIHPTDRLNLKPLNSGNIVEWITIIGQLLKKI
jgi:CheY-like chemotaxis protein